MNKDANDGAPLRGSPSQQEIRDGTRWRIAKTLAVLCASLVAPACFAKEPQVSETKTYCVGRFLVDLPADAQINGQDYRYMFGRIESEPMQLDAKSFDEMVERRATELRETNEDKGRTLKGSVSATPTAKALVTSENIFGSKNYGFEAYWLGQQTLFTLKAMDMNETVFQTRVLPKLRSRLLPYLTARSPDDIPTAPGFCLKDGFITDDGKLPQFENAGIGLKFAKWPGVLVTVETATVTKPGEPKLLERLNMDDLPEQFKHLVSKIHTIRRGERTINGRAGEEDLSTVPTGHGYSVHQFRWESQGSHVSDALEPTLIVELESGMMRDSHGNPARPQLTDEEAVAVFDEVLKSLRLRSGEPSP